MNCKKEIGTYGDRQTERDSDMARQDRTRQDRRNGSQPAATHPARQAVRPTGRQASRKSSREAAKETSRYSNRRAAQTVRQADMRTTQASRPDGKQTVDRRAVIKAHWQALGRQANRQTGGQADRQAR